MEKIMKRTIAALTLGFGLGGTAWAGNLDTTPVEAPVFAPVAPTPVSGEWTGFYGGLQLGFADVDGAAGLEGDNGTYGLHAGYDYDFGSFVLGAEVDYDKTDIDLNAGAAEIENVARLKFKGGYDLGSTLLYATAGAVEADTSIGSESGAFIGVGVNYKVTERYTIGAELLEHRFDDIGGTAGSDLDVTTLNLRGSYRF